MFTKDIYTNRREQLRSDVKSGLILLPGNQEASYNYHKNTYRFRQDSNFLYFFGLNKQNFVGVLDADTGEDWLFADDFDMSSIIWMGDMPKVSELAASVGVANSAPASELRKMIENAVNEGRRVHFCDPYRAVTRHQIAQLVGYRDSKLKNFVSKELIQAIVKQREIKADYEIAELEKAVDAAYLMHTEGMKLAKNVGIYEYQISGRVEGIAMEHGGTVSFPVICSINGQTLHNHYHGNKLVEGRMLVLDAGAELDNCYSSDITRTVPVGGKFSERQKAIYEIVLEANMKSIEMCRPGIKFRDVHIIACQTIAEGLKKLGLMKGDMLKAVEQGAHALFFPHGLGHMMGLDVHDMENLGEDFVGYDEETKRAKDFGLAYLRFGKKLKEGFVVTIEPGCYFIPQLIKQWYDEHTFEEYINYDEVLKYVDFGGIRIEDDVLITKDGHRVLGKPIPKTVAEIEALMA
ncbi:MAG: aminopeptidase P family protein [Bacteroidales bacterium]|jgi:Xaa-Pro aminopeptidase|nr:aminopeptidase P family protein [Bacteroidales bacterium]